MHAWFFCVFVAVSLTLLAVPAPAQVPDWTLLGTFADQPVDLDRASLRVHGSLLTARIRWRDHLDSAQLQELEVDCAGMRQRVLSNRWSRKGSRSWEWRTEDDLAAGSWREYSPGSLGASLTEALCGVVGRGRPRTGA